MTREEAVKKIVARELSIIAAAKATGLKPKTLVDDVRKAREKQ